MLLLDKHNDIRFLVLFPRRKKTKLNAFCLKQVNHLQVEVEYS